MYQFHVILHARPAGLRPGNVLRLQGRSVQTLDIEPRLLAAPMTVSFEMAAEALARLPRMYVEPDGAFVWTGGGPAAWQVDGNLFDRQGRLMYVELKGQCPGEQFDQLLRALGWPHGALIFQLVQYAVWLEEEEFRRVAEVTTTAGTGPGSGPRSP